jgi:hypothetical protein
MKKALFVIEKFCDSNPAHGPTNSEHLLVGSLLSTGLVNDVKRFYYDEMEKISSKEGMERLLLETCRVYRPDLVVFTPMGGPLGHGFNLPAGLVKKLGKVFMIRFDAKPNTRPELEQDQLPHVGLLGSVKAYRLCKDIPGVQMFLGTADPDFFFRAKVVRGIDVSFLGSMDDRRWPLRREYTDFLIANGVNVYTGGGQRGTRLEVSDYASLMNRSKICLNFCRDAGGYTNLKSRVFEVTACGSMLMEDWDGDTAELFTPGEEFVVFNSKEDLLQKVLYYLRHDQEREKIAERGWLKTTRVYNARNQWFYVLEKMGIVLPRSATMGEDYETYRKIMEAL